MKIVVKSLCFLLVATAAVANECISPSSNIEQAIDLYLKDIRAVEYCPARKIQTNGELTLITFNVEGPCFGDIASPPGSCGNNWLSYMLGSINGDIIKPIKIGGKGSFSIEKIKITKNIIELSGLSTGHDDALCCPSVFTTKLFELKNNSFNEIPSVVSINEKLSGTYWNYVWRKRNYKFKFSEDGHIEVLKSWSGVFWKAASQYEILLEAESGKMLLHFNNNYTEFTTIDWDSSPAEGYLIKN